MLASRRHGLIAALLGAAFSGMAAAMPGGPTAPAIDSRGPYGHRPGPGTARYQRAARKRRNVIRNRKAHRG